ncbi:hypothetical protein [Arthrobacter ramosus]|uniref:Uncharacterized protein n=1 Tax=Arthrobacter ramosus TaxID=1672 RepID=A0ABV5Y4S2_ARTRM|nr:hypothetical protein [Arthrobacter ramosus]
MNANAQQKFDIAVPGTVNAVYGAVMKVVEAGPYKKVEPVHAMKMVSFRTGGSLMTWGQRWMVQVAIGIDGQPHVSATVTPRIGAAQFDAARIAKLANTFYQKVGIAAETV